MPPAKSRLALASTILLLAIPVSARPVWAAGNLFEAIGEALFGQPAAQFAPAQPADRGPMSVTVTPGARTAPPSRPRYITMKPKEPAVKLDPETDPTWYLRDPTLRRGDIIVLKTGVVVFDGQSKSEHMTGDFTPLGQTRLISPIRRQEIADMARGIKSPTHLNSSLSQRRAEANAAP